MTFKLLCSFCLCGKKGVHICIVQCYYLIFGVTSMRFLTGSVTLGILPWRSLAFQTARVEWSVSDTEKWTEPWKCLFLSIDCSGNLDTAQRRTSALQTSKCGQMDITPAVMCSVEFQLLLCRRSWSYVFRKKVDLCCAFWDQHNSSTQENGKKTEAKRKKELTESHPSYNSLAISRLRGDRKS